MHIIFAIITEPSMASRFPTLSEILLDKSSPPWTLQAFKAYLSESHCMETLEFALDSKRYTIIYFQLAAEISPSSQNTEQVCGWWEKLMNVYIVPNAPREVNIPSRVRDELLNLPTRDSPPHPSKLNEANRIIIELMNDLLAPFVQSVGPHQTVSPSYDRACSLNQHSFNRGSHAVNQPARSLVSRRIVECLDSIDNNSPLVMEPIAPLTAPPTSEFAFHTPPGGPQAPVAAHIKGWEKLRAKLGFGRRLSGQ